jgi:hypothetical protein
MTHECDLFEKFPDGSSLWRGFALDLEITRHRLRELAQESENQFYAIDITTGEVLAFDSERDACGLLAPLKTKDEARAKLLRNRTLAWPLLGRMLIIGPKLGVM